MTKQEAIEKAWIDEIGGEMYDIIKDFMFKDGIVNSYDVHPITLRLKDYDVLEESDIGFHTAPNPLTR